MARRACRDGPQLSLSRKLVVALRASARQPLPAEVAGAARLHFLDALGVGLAASAAAVGEPYRGLTRELARGGAATVFGSRVGAAPADAALINGGLCHSLEFDDTHTGSIMHGSSVLAPAALATAEAASAGGAEMLGAYARGWEVLVRLGLAAPGRFHAAGFQATSVAGAIAAALVAAELSDLDEDRSVAAVGIALSQGSGVMEFLSNGSSVKSLHSGWAAHGGVLAATLARAGMTGPETALEGRNGLFQQYARSDDAAGRFEASMADIGRRWHLAEAAFKFHPCCHYLHPFIEAAGLLADRGVKPEAVSSILCRVPAGAAPVICEPWALKQAPETGHAARWSLPIVVAERIASGKVDLATFERVSGSDVRALARRVSWEPLENARFPERFEAELRCELVSGKVEEVRMDDAFGNHSRPPGEAAVLAKFQANAAQALPPGSAEAVMQALAASDRDALSAALRAAR
jgi:2-methylcitrate dehydratase PrpD